MVLFFRALTAFLVLPGIIAFLVPWLLRPTAGRLHFVGIPLLGAGTFLLLWCVWDFYVSGRGSLAPWAPPRRLVRVGLYRISRNPMYIAVVLVLAGWALLFQARALWIYLAAVAITFHLRVVFGEEPWLARTHGEAWQAYRTRVPRWLGFTKMSSSGLTAISTFRSTADAHVAKGILDEAGIESMIRADDAGGMYPAIGGAQLMVRLEDTEKAHDLLRGAVRRRNGAAVVG